MVIEQLTIIYGDVTETVNVVRLKLRRRAKMFSLLRGSAKDAKDISFENMAEYTVQLISESLCDASGKTLFTPDDVDEWPDRKITAYREALNAYQNPKMEDAAKNSSSTPSATS